MKFDEIPSFSKKSRMAIIEIAMCDTVGSGIPKLVKTNYQINLEYAVDLKSVHTSFP